MDALLGSRIATPGFLPGAIRCPSCLGAGRVPARWRGGAWWLENWIVDASNAGFFVLLALSRFRQASFLESGFEIDRFVIIFYSVMICRLGIC